jgi:hypothetical protein
MSEIMWPEKSVVGDGWPVVELLEDGPTIITIFDSPESQYEYVKQSEASQEQKSMAPSPRYAVVFVRMDKEE